MCSTLLLNVYQISKIYVFFDSYLMIPNNEVENEIFFKPLRKMRNLKSIDFRDSYGFPFGEMINERKRSTRWTNLAQCNWCWHSRHAYILKEIVIKGYISIEWLIKLLETQTSFKNITFESYCHFETLDNGYTRHHLGMIRETLRYGLKLQRVEYFARAINQFWSNAKVTCMFRLTFFEAKSKFRGKFYREIRHGWMLTTRVEWPVILLYRNKYTIL